MNNPFKHWHPAEVVIAILLAICIGVVLTACGGGGSDEEEPSVSTIPVNCPASAGGCK